MDRRKFIQQSCSLCVAVGAGMVVGSLSSCSVLPTYKTSIANNKVTVPVALFTQGNFQLIQPKNLYYNIGLKKEADGTYTALLLKCTHADNQLTPAGNSGYKCTLHGSTFNMDGKVTAGPAERPLKKYTTEVISDQIIIHLS
ncbi:ubiquinol-cytochrome c reductase iron-sulfur subunit [Mucilaginibacter sp. SP1R1]|uniref:QcrA and Rieske domain-containing protein n=1 Tax=Mucilaginibacter sp. SP1R1 TaxID=2723091 RepID=UPI001621EE6D|nr:Rieske 2Fe-2S domain-containing protein [Mucilaginibacter sp. SP1R1]MBB6149222.1 Rieske Fe-S protein [Mucilaginibacter sp. SP1R1]